MIQYYITDICERGMKVDRKEARKNTEMDDFWDIDALLPPRRAAHYPHDTEAVEVSFDAPAEKQAEGKRVAIPPKREEPERHFIPPHTPKELEGAPRPDAEYTPERSLIRTVRLFRQKSNYPYYEDFLRDAMRLYAVKGAECSHVPFFSYVPQYSQMNRAQLEWYLWWRARFREGEYLTTDYSYLLLHAYEMINLAGRIEPSVARDALLRLWLHYREVFRQLDGYIPEWICDLCLIHRLPPPEGLSGTALNVALSKCALKEFYMMASGEDGILRILPVYCSNYDFHKSKFCTEENKPLFERLILGTLSELVHKTGQNGGLFDTDTMDTGRMVRLSYQGALCAQSVKRKIAVEYTSFSCSHELRYRITDVIKYTENRIRAYLGVRSRLSVCALNASLRALIDAYLDTQLPQKAVAERGARAESAEYERLYDLPRTPLSLSRAKEIELDSWDTTEQLIEAFEGDTEEQGEEALPMPIPPMPDASTEDAWRVACVPYAAFIEAALDEDFAAQRAVAKSLGKMPDAVADAINGIVFDGMGDVLLEDTGDGYAVIEDYRALAQELCAQGKDGNDGK